MKVVRKAPPPLRVGLVGLGLIGQRFVVLLGERKPEGLELIGVTPHDRTAGARKMAELGCDAPVLPLEELVERADVVAEVTTVAALRRIAEFVLGADKTLLCASAAGLLECEDLVARTREPGGGRIIIPSGGLAGLDVIRAVTETGVNSIIVESRFEPIGLAHSDYVKELGIDLLNIVEPVVVFQGPIRELAKRFPRHFNVAVTLLIATRSEVDIQWSVLADPAMVRSQHTIMVDSDAGNFTLRAHHNYLGAHRAARIVAPSMLAALRRLVDPVVAGS